MKTTLLSKTRHGRGYFLIGLLLLALVLTPVFRLQTLAEGSAPTLEDYLQIQNDDTPLGLRQVPEITDLKLLRNPATQAFMDQVQAALAEQDDNIAAITEEWGDQEIEQLPAYNPETIFKTCAALVDNIFSLAVSYTPLTLLEPHQYLLFSLNLDLSTGQELDYKDLVSLAGYSQEDVDFSIREISRQNLERDLYRMNVANAALEGTLPDLTVLPETDPGVIDNTIEYCLDYFHAGLEARVDAYGRYPAPPAVFYQGPGKLFVSAPVATWYGSFSTLIPVLRTSDEVTALAAWDPFNEELLGLGILSPEAALAGVRALCSVDETGLTPAHQKFSFEVVGMNNLPWEEFNEGPCYVVKVYREPGTRDLATYYVSSSSGAILEPVGKEEWAYTEGDLCPYHGDPVEDCRDHEAAGFIIANLDPYEEWLSRPHFTADVVKLMDEIQGVVSEPYPAEDYLTCLVTVGEDNALVTVEYGNSSGEWGVMDHTIYSEKLQAGQSLVVTYPWIDERHVGVRVTTDQGEAFFNMSYLNYEEERQVYLKYNAEEEEPALEDYVTLSYTETPMGSRLLPSFTQASLEENPASQEFMAKLQELIQIQDQNIAEIQAQAARENWDQPDMSDNSLVSTFVYLEDNILTLFVRYTPFDPLGPLQYKHFSLNLDLETGQALGYADLLSRAGFTDEDVKYSIREIGSQFLAKEYARMRVYQACEEGLLPDVSDPPFQWEDFAPTLDYCLDHFQAFLEDRPDDYGLAPEPPALAYLGPGELYISAYLPTMAGAGYFESQIPIVRTRDQATALATYDLFGNQILGYGMVSPQAALDAARKRFHLDDQGRNPDGIPVSLALAGMQQIALDEDRTEPAYLVEAYEDHEDHKSNMGWLFVLVYSGNVLDYDIVMDEWSFAEENFSFYDGELVMDGMDRQAVASIFPQLDAYDEWQARPHLTANLSDNGSDSGAEEAQNLPAMWLTSPVNSTDEDMRNCLLTLMEPEAQVMVESQGGSSQGDPDQIKYQAQLVRGQSLLLVYLAEMGQDLTICIRTGKGEICYPLSDLPNQATGEGIWLQLTE